MAGTCDLTYVPLADKAADTVVIDYDFYIGPNDQICLPDILSVHNRVLNGTIHQQFDETGLPFTVELLGITGIQIILLIQILLIILGLLLNYFTYKTLYRIPTWTSAYTVPRVLCVADFILLVCELLKLARSVVGILRNSQGAYWSSIAFTVVPEVVSHTHVLPLVMWCILLGLLERYLVLIGPFSEPRKHWNRFLADLFLGNKKPTLVVLVLLYVIGTSPSYVMMTLGKGMYGFTLLFIVYGYIAPGVFSLQLLLLFKRRKLILVGVTNPQRQEAAQGSQEVSTERIAEPNDPGQNNTGQNDPGQNNSDTPITRASTPPPIVDYKSASVYALVILAIVILLMTPILLTYYWWSTCIMLAVIERRVGWCRPGERLYSWCVLMESYYIIALVLCKTFVYRSTWPQFWVRNQSVIYTSLGGHFPFFKPPEQSATNQYCNV